MLAEWAKLNTDKQPKFKHFSITTTASSPALNSFTPYEFRSSYSHLTSAFTCLAIPQTHTEFLAGSRPQRCEEDKNTPDCGNSSFSCAEGHRQWPFRM